MNSLNLNESPQFDDPKYNAVPETETPTNPMLVSCPACQHRVSTNAACCPGCGRRFQHKQQSIVLPLQQPTLGRIVGGIVLGYICIMILNAVFFFLFATLFVGIIGNAVNSAPRTSPNYYNGR